MCGYAKNAMQAVFLINLPALVVFILCMVQLLSYGTFWANMLGRAPLIFFSPVLNLSFGLALWSEPFLHVFVIAFILMVAASALGCLIRKRRRLKKRGIYLNKAVCR